jgi:hypothetical protein
VVVDVEVVVAAVVVVVSAAAPLSDDSPAAAVVVVSSLAPSSELLQDAASSRMATMIAVLRTVTVPPYRSPDSPASLPENKDHTIRRHAIRSARLVASAVVEGGDEERTHALDGARRPGLDGGR